MTARPMRGGGGGLVYPPRCCRAPQSTPISKARSSEATEHPFGHDKEPSSVPARLPASSQVRTEASLPRAERQLGKKRRILRHVSKALQDTERKNRHNSSCPDAAAAPPSSDSPFPSGSSPRKCLSRTVNTSAHTATPVNLRTSSMSACLHEGSSLSSAAPPPVPAAPGGSVGWCVPLAPGPFRRRKASSWLAVPTAGWLLVLDEEA